MTRKGKRFNIQEDNFIALNYLDYPLRTLAKTMGRSQSAVLHRQQFLGLVTPPEIMERKLWSRFKKGQAGWNKGVSSYQYLSPENIEKQKATWFKKGRINWNTQPDGTIRVRGDNKKGFMYKYIKVDGAWKMLHVHNWEQEYGQVPDGYIVVFIDYDAMNCEVWNLACITVAHNAVRNSGSTRLTDRLVAMYLATKNKPELIDEYLKFPELIKSHRELLLTKRELKKTIQPL